MDIEVIRAQFPALKRTHNGLPVAYFDGPGGTQVPLAVAEAVTDYLLHHNANTHWPYPTSAETDAILEGAREAVGRFLGASVREIAFGANMTTLTFHLARALGRTWGRGDEVIVTELDHHANVAPWRALERDFGIVVRVARMDAERGQLDYGHLQSLAGPRTRLIAAGGASNALGTINDLAKISAIARRASALLFVDAVHLAPHAPIDVRAIDCDFLACSAYKFYGPHVGILYGRETLLEGLPFPKLAPSPDTAPERVETGTQNHEGIAGVRAAVEFMESVYGAGRNARHEDRGRPLSARLRELPGVRVFGPADDAPRTPTVAFTVDGMDADDVARALAERAIFVSSGDFYAATVRERLGVAAFVRAGAAVYTTEEEIKRLVEAVAAL